MTKIPQKNEFSFFSGRRLPLNFKSMTVYIEYVFLSNLIFNFLLLHFTVKILKIKYKKLRLFLSDLFGTAVAIIIPLFNIASILAVIVKLALSVGIVLILASYKSKKQFFAALLLFWGLTFALGGVLFGIYFIFGIDFSLQQDLSVVSNSPLPLFIGGILCFIFLTKNLVAYISGKKASAKFVYDVALILDGKRLNLQGFLDSGNMLEDEASGLPVVIIVSQKIKAAVKEKVAEILLNKTDGIKNAHYISFSTLAGGRQKMFVFAADGFFVGDRQFDVVLGLAESNAPIKGECDVLLNAKMGL